MTAQRRAHGFTLIEMLVALVIAAILLLIAGPAFTTFLRNSEIRSTSESIVNGLRAASAEAARQNQRVLFTLAAANSPSWKFNLVTSPADCSVTAPDPAIQAFPQEEAGKNSKATTSPADKRTVCFNGLGRITSDAHMLQIDIAPLVANEARPLRVVVDDQLATGRGIRLCDPALPSTDPKAC